MDSVGNTLSKTTIFNLPEEILEYILSLISPYKDIKSAMQVCRLWKKCVPGVARKLQVDFYKTVGESGLQWYQHPPEPGPVITERYSHSSCYHANSVYIFGGCTSSNTAFNDLWRFDLDNQHWIRPLATGTYPSPKACASMVPYRDGLLLFGGWSQPTPFPLHQADKFFSELHVYTPSLNRWAQIFTSTTPPGRAGHGASIVGDSMVVFGGFLGHAASCNDIWVLDLREAAEMMWHKKDIPGVKPLPRYRHSQIVLDETHILVIGGCGGPNMQFSDVWLLEMGSGQWNWQEVRVQGQEFAASQLWCHPACKVEDKVVVLSKGPKIIRNQPIPDKSELVPSISAVWVPPTQNGVTQGQGQKTLRSRGHMNQSRQWKRPPPETSESSSQESSSDTEGDPQRSYSRGHDLSSRSPKQSAGSRAAGLPPPSGATDRNSTGARFGHGLPSVRPNAMKNRQRQLETLRRYEEKFRQLSKSPPEGSSSEGCFTEQQGLGLSPAIQRVLNPMNIHVLDASKAVSHNRVTWLPARPQDLDNAPEDRMLYSLTAGRAELIMFGGLQNLNEPTMSIRGGKKTGQRVTNEVHFIRAPRTLR